MLLCEELILIKVQSPRQGRPPEPHLNVMNSRSVEGIWACSLWFLHPYVSGVCCLAFVPSRVFVLRSPLELSIMPSAEDSFSHLRHLPVARSGCPVPPVAEGWHSRDSLYYPIQWVESKDEATWELVWGLGYLGSSLPSCPSYLWTTSFIGRIFPGLHTR